MAPYPSTQNCLSHLSYLTVIDDLRKWLDPPNPRPANYDVKRQAGSCEWFFDDQFEDWKARKNGVYWVYGNGTVSSLAFGLPSDLTCKRARERAS